VLNDIDELVAADLADLQDAEITMNLLDNEMAEVGLSATSTKDMTTQQLLDMLEKQT